MQHEATKLATEIIDKVNRLAKLAEANLESLMSLAEPKNDQTKKKSKGATGGLRYLIEDGFFENPKVLTEVRERLKQEGRHYPNPTISMGLLGLVRERELTRIQEDGKKIWKYVIRR